MTLQIGTVLNNAYRIVTPLGETGVGTIYRVWDLNRGCPCILLESPAEVPAQKLLEIKQEIRDRFEILDHALYLVMDYAEEENVDGLLRQFGNLIPKNGSPLQSRKTEAPNSKLLFWMLGIGLGCAGIIITIGLLVVIVYLLLY